MVRPLLTLVRSGGTRLQEGQAALVGLPADARIVRRRARWGGPLPGSL